MKFFVIFQGEGAERIEVFINLAQVVDVVSHTDGKLIVHMSNGHEYEVGPETKKQFKAFLQQLA
jgi:hypothetical protein